MRSQGLSPWLEVRDLLRMNELERELIESPSCPTLAQAARRVLELCSREQVDLIALADAVSSDAELEAGVLRLVRSRPYASPPGLESLRQATLYLGFDVVRSMSLAFSVVRALRGVPGGASPQADELWRTCVSNGLAARRLAEEVGGWDAEEAFLAGLVVDCGAVLLHQRLPGYAELLGPFREGRSDLLDLERGSLRTDHMRLGELLLGKWGFPQGLRTLVGCHHAASDPRVDSLPEPRVRILGAAWLCARTLTVAGFAGEAELLPRKVAGILGLPVRLVQAILSELPDEIRETASILGIEGGGQPEFAELVARATRKGSGSPAVGRPALTVDAGGPTYDRVLFTDLKRQLDSSLLADARTGLLARESLDRILQSFHERAREARSPVGLVLIEVAELKDRRDAAATDLVREIRARIETQIRTSDVCGRFADDQIAVIVAGCGRSHLEHVAERLRVALEGRPVRAASDSLSLSVTIGVAGTSPHMDGLDVGSLVRLACSALDRAQGSPDRIVIEG